jgi:hypothetical protein
MRLNNENKEAKETAVATMKITMFSAYDKAKPNMEHIRDLNLAVVKLTTIQMNKLPL